MARQLADAGWRVSVLTPNERFMQPLDAASPDLPALEVLRTGMFRPVAAVQWFSRVSSMVRGRRKAASEGTDGAVTGGGSDSARGPSTTVKHLAKWLESQLAYPDPWNGWRPFAVRALSGRRFDLVLSTIPPFTTAVIGRELARQTHAQLVLDYRDPWSDSVDRIPMRGRSAARLLERLRRLEDEHLREANFVLGASPSICRLLRDRTGAQVLFLPNAAESVADRSSARTHKRHLVYAGSLSYGRSLTPVLRGLQRVHRDPLGNSARVLYAGPHGAQATREAEALGQPDLVADLGNVPQVQVREIMSTAMAGIVVVSSNYEYMLPGKVFEIIEHGRPILLIGSRQSDASRLVVEHELGWALEPTDEEGIAGAIEHAIRGEIPKPRNLELLSAEHVGKLLDTALTALLQVNGTRRH